VICALCPSKKAKPRAYTYAGQTSLVSTCPDCDAKSRTELALGESKYSIPSALGSYERELVRPREKGQRPIPYQTAPGASAPRSDDRYKGTTGRKRRMPGAMGRSP
jgi:hypothetical protein